MVWLLGLSVSWWAVSLLIVLIATYLYMTWDPYIWKSQGVPGPFIYPVIGTNYLMFKKGIRAYCMKNYAKYGKLFGAFEGKYPTLYVSEEDMLRDVLVKNFSNFANRKVLRLPSDRIAMSMVTSLEDGDWKRVRNLLTPSFSTGKLKMMMASIGECVEQLDGTLSELSGQGGDADVKQVFGAYTMDVIARVGFGIQVNAQKEQEKSDFVRLGQKAFQFSLLNPVILIFFLFPWALRILRNLDISVFDRETKDFFVAHLKQTIEKRKEGDPGQKDFLQLMLNAHREDVDEDEIKSEAKELGGEYDHADSKVGTGLTEDEILAQGFLFFVAGYETTAHTLTMLAHSLARNPECQEKLYEEITSMGEEDTVDYQTLNKMEYLNMCIDETLRLYPPAVRLDRVASRETNVGHVRVPKGAVISIPIVGIHHDPAIYPEPYQFRPERFSAEAKVSRSPFHYMPFGYGPRNCIGMRLARMEIQMAAMRVVKNYRFLATPQTEYPVEFRKLGVVVPKNKIWLRVERRAYMTTE